MTANAGRGGIAVVVIDWRFTYRKPGDRQTSTVDTVERSLRRLLDQLGLGLQKTLYLGFALGPPEGIRSGSIEVERFHARERSLELYVGFDTTVADDEVGPAFGRLAIEAIEVGRQELARRKVDLDTDLVVARIEEWISRREWSELIPTPPRSDVDAHLADRSAMSEDGGWPEALEIHVGYEKALGSWGAFTAMGPVEGTLDQFLDGLGALEGNEMGAEEWITYINCDDADAVLAKLLPKLRELRGVGSIYAEIRRRHTDRRTRVPVR